MTQGAAERTLAAVGHYLSVGDPIWANRRRLAVAAIAFALSFMAWSMLFESDHEFARGNISDLSDILIVSMTIYGGGSTAAQIFEKWMEGRGARRRASEPAPKRPSGRVQGG